MNVRCCGPRPTAAGVPGAGVRGRGERDRQLAGRGRGRRGGREQLRLLESARARRSAAPPSAAGVASGADPVRTEGTCASAGTRTRSHRRRSPSCRWPPDWSTPTRPGPAGGASTRWYLTAIDARTGETAFSVRTGTGTMSNNHYAAVTLAPDGSAYIATLAGIVRSPTGTRARAARVGRADLDRALAQQLHRHEIDAASSRPTPTAAARRLPEGTQLSAVAHRHRRARTRTSSLRHGPDGPADAAVVGKGTPRRRAGGVPRAGDGQQRRAQEPRSWVRAAPLARPRACSS